MTRPEPTIPLPPDAAAASAQAHVDVNAALTPLVYARLRAMARRYLAGERQDHTFNATDLVHAAYLRLLDQRQGFHGGRDQFLALAALMMRRILVNHALARRTGKRGAGEPHLTLGAAADVAQTEHGAAVDVLALDRALERLGRVDARMVAVIELRYFAGASVEDTAAALGISAATVKREWTLARMWLAKELG